MTLKSFLLVLVPLCAAVAGDEAFNGRWDIQAPGQSRGWWLEIQNAGTPRAAGFFVTAYGGQNNEIRDLLISGGELSFSFWRPFRGRDSEPELRVWRARLVDGKLEGLYLPPGGQPMTWIGVRAPEIAEADDGTWNEGEPVRLFNGNDLSGWRSVAPSTPVNWEVADGALKNRPGARDIVSAQKFWNFKLHVEYRVAAHSNSGIGLRGRYEVQILEDYGRPADAHGNGAIYGRVAPTANASKPAGEWQTFDVRLVGRTVTITLNGTTIIDHKIIEGLTAIAGDSNEGEPGPIILQGDHGPVEFRSVVLTPLVK